MNIVRVRLHPTSLMSQLRNRPIRHVRSRLQRVQEGVSGLRFGRASTIVVVSQVAIPVALVTVAGAQFRSFVDDWMSLDDGAEARPGYLIAQLRWDSTPSGSRTEASQIEVHGARYPEHLQKMVGR